jgi:predicted membrane chloride channel (bestrophin family)
MTSGTDNDKDDDDIISKDISSLPPPKYYESRLIRMNTTNNGIETDSYDRVKRKDRLSPTRDLNYTSEMWRKHKSPWRHLIITATIFKDSPFQRLLFPDFTIITSISIMLSAIALHGDFFTGVTGLEFINNLERLEKSMEPLSTTLGTIIALLLGYRVNTTYDRYCDARTMWGELTNASRDLARNVCTYIPTHNKNKSSMAYDDDDDDDDDTNKNHDMILMIRNKQRLLNLIRMYPIALHFFLTTKGSHHNLSRKDSDFGQQVFIEFRAECLDSWNIYNNDGDVVINNNNSNDHDDGSNYDDDPDLIRIFDGFQDKKHYPLLILNMMGECLAELSSSSSSSSSLNDNKSNESIINPFFIRELDRQIQRMTSGPFERILRTPMPTAFTRYASRVTTLWAYTVPFGLITYFGPYFNPIGSLFVCYCVMAIDDIGIQLEEPFNIMPQRQYSDGIVDAVNLIETSFIAQNNPKGNSNEQISIKYLSERTNESDT